MPNDHIFIVTSTINTNIGYMPPPVRFEQTLETVHSIQRQAPGSHIIFVDNSTVPLTEHMTDSIHKMVDHFLWVGHRQACKLFNQGGVRSAGEVYMLLVAMDLIRTQLSGDIKRVFKLSGRYKLTLDFSIADYDQAVYQGKYCFRKTSSVQDKCYHTRLWSFCASLLLETDQMLKLALASIFEKQQNIEEVLFEILDPCKVVQRDLIHCEGKPALWNNVHITE